MNGNQADNSALNSGAAYVFGGVSSVTSVFGSGCGGLSLGSLGAPVLGSATFQVTLSGAPPLKSARLIVGASDAVWAGIPLPLDLAPFGAPGCTLLTGLNLLLPTVTDFSGNAALALPIPNDPALLGVQVFFQWEVFDPSQNAVGAVFSDGLAVTFFQ